MKTILSIITALTLFMGISCHTKDVSNNAHPLEGFWHIDSYWAFSADPMPTFGPSDVIWRFQFEEQKLTVTYNVSAAFDYVIAPGEHTLTGNGNILTIDGDMYKYEFIDSKVKIKRHYGEFEIADLPEVTLAR